MLNPRARAVLTAYGVLGVVQVVAQATGPGWFAGLTQVLLMPVLALALLARTASPRSRLVTLSLAALGGSWLGDTGPRLLDGDLAFLTMVGCFLVAQVCYIAAFRPYLAQSVVRRSRAWLTAYGVVVVGLVAVCLPGAGVLAPAVLVYGLCLGTMAVLATGVDRLAWVGGAFFLVSDGLIAIDAFSGLDLPAHDVSVMATYVVAQLLLVLGVIRRDERRAPDGSPASSGRGSSASADPRRTTPGPAGPPP
ncbi:lysoplasmalogenase [Nocardioides conyzicola]|uniref:Lysoplasmalogenase n=1 Tax=Nocardioides conyzicola TaxID=1651781 RepID=A0ABP8XQT9_9ACTN